MRLSESDPSPDSPRELKLAAEEWRKATIELESLAIEQLRNIRIESDAESLRRIIEEKERTYKRAQDLALRVASLKETLRFRSLPSERDQLLLSASDDALEAVRSTLASIADLENQAQIALKDRLIAMEEKLKSVHHKRQVYDVYKTKPMQEARFMDSKR